MAFSEGVVLKLFQKKVRRKTLCRPLKLDMELKIISQIIISHHYTEAHSTVLESLLSFDHNIMIQQLIPAYVKKHFHFHPHQVL